MTRRFRFQLQSADVLRVVRGSGDTICCADEGRCHSIEKGRKSVVYLV